MKGLIKNLYVSYVQPTNKRSDIQGLYIGYNYYLASAKL